MAAFLGVGVNFSMQMVIETDDDRLARIVETLLVVESSEEKEEEELLKRLVIRPMKAGEPVSAPTGGEEVPPVYVEMVNMNGEPVKVPIEALKRAAEQTEKLAKIVKAARERRKTESKTCTYCGTPISAKAKMCGKPECKRKYNNEQYAKRKGKTQEAIVATYDAEGGGKAVDESPGDPFPADVKISELPWPADGSLFRVLDGKLKGTTYANWEMSEALADGDLEPGTMVEHRHLGMHQVQTTLDGPRDKYTGGGQKLRLVRMQAQKESSMEPSEEPAGRSSDPADRGAD